MAKRAVRLPRPADAPMRAVVYTRVSTEEQARSGHGLQAQWMAATTEVERRGWVTVEIVPDEGISGARRFDKRPGGQRALELLETDGADVLVVSKLDRLSRSVTHFGDLLERAARDGWQVVCFDLGVDTTTPAGELAANVVVSAAQYERRLAQQRTRDGLAAARAKGVRLGGPQLLPDDVVARIVDERRAGQSLPAIAAGLERDAVPTARGGPRWYPSTVAAVLRSQAAAALV